MYTHHLQFSKTPTHCECATILAALSFWQEYRDAGGAVPEHFDYFEDGTPELSTKEIDALRESINLSPL